MKSIQSLLLNLNTVLNAISDDLTIYHYESPTDCDIPYGVWTEEGEGEAFNSNNKKSEQIIAGSVDFYTQTEFDTLVDSIQEALNECEGCSWVLDTVQYEDETKLIHYTWTWELS